MARPKPKPTKAPKPKPQPTTSKWWTANENLKAKGGIVNINGVDMNAGGSPYTRWKASGQITPMQERAVDHCMKLWELTGITGPSTTAGYGDRIAGGCREEPEWLVAKILDARTDLARVEGYFDGIRSYWHVFENCIRHDEPAGAVGSRLMGWGNANAVGKALVTVQFVADMIAVKERLVV